MSQKTISAVQGLAVAIISALVSFGVLGGDKASSIQAIVVAAITFGAAVGIHSARPANTDVPTDTPVDAPTETPSGE